MKIGVRPAAPTMTGLSATDGGPVPEVTAEGNQRREALSRRLEVRQFDRHRDGPSALTCLLVLSPDIVGHLEHARFDCPPEPNAPAGHIQDHLHQRATGPARRVLERCGCHIAALLYTNQCQSCDTDLGSQAGLAQSGLGPCDLEHRSKVRPARFRLQTAPEGSRRNAPR